jgi:hypothetical protein
MDLRAEQERMKARNQPDNGHFCHKFTQPDIEQPDPAFEQHYSVKQIAARWGLGVDKVRELFRDELVPKIGKGERRACRGYITMTIPEGVVRKVYARLCEKK